MLIPDPCFIESIRRESGSRRVLIHIANGTGSTQHLSIDDVRKPEWLDIEGAMIGDELQFRKGGKLPLVVNINTDHRFFPTESSVKEEVYLSFSGGLSVSVYIYLQEIISTAESFRGVFAMDFGTTNTCYAWKARVGDKLSMSDAVKPPEVSREIPTLIRFRDISQRESPLVEIGHQAKDYIAHNSGRSFQYCISVKRMLGLERDILVLDDRSGLEPDRYQNYKPEEVAGFIVRELLKQAENTIGQRIEQVVATFPILYNHRKRAALRKAFELAFTGLNREWREDRLILRVDETNAAAFNYIYGHLMDEFRRFSVSQSAHRILSYDFGGGTIDVSLLDVDLSRDASGRIAIATRMLGITGERYFGGDNVTLAALKILKHRLALRIASLRLEAIAAESAAAEADAAAQSQADNPWSFSAATTEAPAAADDPWANLADGSDEKDASENADVVDEEDEEDPETADIQCMTPLSRQRQAWETLEQYKEVVELSCQWGTAWRDTIQRMVDNGVLDLPTHEIAEVALAIADAIDIVLPTRSKVLEQSGDLIAKEVAKKLFYELWLPAEVVKIKAVGGQGSADLTEPLHKVAKYGGVRAEDLMGVTVSESEINAAIDGPLRRSIGKAGALLQLAYDQGPSSSSGLNFGGLGDQQADTERTTTVLLAGNGARLPKVRSLVSEICQVDADRVVMDPRGLKATVAQGVCEEHLLRQDFGSQQGLIQYTTGDFTDKIPYTIGLFHPELALVGYAGGFAPVMSRGTEVGRVVDGERHDSMVLLTDALQILHRDSKELPVFAWFHDHQLGLDGKSAGPMMGVEPSSLGWFDLTAAEDAPYEGVIPESIIEQVRQLKESDGDRYCVILALDENRDLCLVDPDDRRCYRLRVAAETIDDAENPFSGVH